MTRYKRLIAQIHDINADSPQQADEIARLRADAANTALRPLGAATAWAVTVADAASGADELMDILHGTYLLDEIDDNPEKHPHAGPVEIEHTTIPERLIAWRDAAVKAALDQAAAAQDATGGAR